MTEISRRTFLKAAGSTVPLGLIPSTAYATGPLKTETMSVSAEFLKEAITRALKQTKGEALGGAIAFLAFGGHSVPGLIDGAELSLKAEQVDLNSFTQDRAVSLGADLVKDCLLFLLKKTAAKSLAGVEVALEGLVTMNLLIVQSIFTPTELGNATLHGPQTSNPVTQIHPSSPAPVPPFTTSFGGTCIS